jgi:hypothetical protein
MKSRTTSKKSKLSKITTMSLGDLVSAVSSYAQNERETLAAMQDLFRRGSVVAQTAQGSKRLRLA